MTAPRTVLALLLAAGCALAAAAPAAASSSQATYFEAPRDLLFGEPAAREATFQRLDSLGVKAVRITLFWRDVAPDASATRKPDFDTTDPTQSYNFSKYDPAIIAAKQRGWKLLLTVSGPAPTWAITEPKAGVEGTIRPRPAEFAQFTTAVGRRYGDLVDVYSVWNEPNLTRFLGPQYDRDGRAVSPSIYRGLYAAFQKGIEFAGHGDTPVLLGEMAPRKNRATVAPLQFLRGVLRLDSRYRKLPGAQRVDADGVAVHAYTTATGPRFVPPNKDDVTIGVVSRIVRAVDRSARAGVLPRRLPIYLTEFGIESTPDTLRGVSLQRQAEFRSYSERLAYRQPRVAAFSQYLLTDDSPREDVSELERYSGFETGLLRSDGRVKPSYDGFRLPLVVTPTSRTRASLWGLVRPAIGSATPVTIQRRTGGSGAWRDVGTATTDTRGSFTLTTTWSSDRQYRVVWASPDGTRFEGAPTRAVDRP